MRDRRDFSILLTLLQPMFNDVQNTYFDFFFLFLQKTNLNLLIMQSHSTVAWLSHSQVTAQNLRKSRNEPGNNESKLQGAAAWN